MAILDRVFFLPLGTWTPLIMMITVYELYVIMILSIILFQEIACGRSFNCSCPGRTGQGGARACATCLGAWALAPGWALANGDWTMEGEDFIMFYLYIYIWFHGISHGEPVFRGYCGISDVRNERWVWKRYLTPQWTPWPMAILRWDMINHWIWGYGTLSFRPNGEMNGSR